ncbi:uncharacterized protein [Dendropsophus ebraccatus]|uniref:uncharacterized protein n=1 Tax=Dendropsophus ebraccatus TaxID=150705 RepID=UPI003831B78D
MSCFNQSEVGIFSREDVTCYEWLIDVIRSVWGVKAVHPVLITNTGGHFEQRVPKCSLAILYHSKTRGRLNVTDVTDSLYDEELQYMSRELGKKRVIVVIDHMEKTGEEDKSRILKNQPSICRLADRLILLNGGTGTERAELRSFTGLIRRKALRVLISKLIIWLVFLLVLLTIIAIIVGVESSKQSGGHKPISDHNGDMPGRSGTTNHIPVGDQGR